MQRHRLYTRACDEFAACFSWAGGRLVHFCGGARCCKSSEVYKRRAQQNIVNIAYRCAPTVPTKATWTNTGPCVDFHVLAQAFDLLVRQFALAFGAKGMQVHIVKASGFEDQLIVEEISWHRAAGIRSAKAREMLSDAQSYFRIAILAIVFEPLRFLTRWFMVEGSDRRRHQRQKMSLSPSLCHLVAGNTSPGAAVMQYSSPVHVRFACGCSFCGPASRASRLGRPCTRTWCASSGVASCVQLHGCTLGMSRCDGGGRSSWPESSTTGWQCSSVCRAPRVSSNRRMTCWAQRSAADCKRTILARRSSSRTGGRRRSPCGQGRSGCPSVHASSFMAGTGGAQCTANASTAS